MNSLLQNANFHIYLADDTLVIDIINGKYNKENFMSGIQYLQNFWLLIANTDDKYHQMFIFNDVGLYPLDFYTSIISTLKSLESIYKTHLHSSCVVSNSNAFEIMKPVLNMYKAVRPFKFVSTEEEGRTFLQSNK